ncbi:MAG: Urea carboxylase-related aminomethyltransferase [Frankiales bacterium]|nr:Urea carboxylase-related aminomethyltransferase [Frankiales bacterium]
MLVAHDVPGGAAWSVRVRAGRELRCTALGPDANLSLLLLRADDPLDRLNVPDTLKAQMSACVRAPMVLMSDRGIGLATVTGSSLDWHDALCGHSTDVHVAPFGLTSYQDVRNERRVSARAGLLSELRKHGRDRADLHGSVNLFSKVALDDSGGLARVPGWSAEGDWVTLRSEVELLVLMSTSIHPLATTWAPPPVRVEISEAPADESARLFRDESARALEQAARAVV